MPKHERDNCRFVAAATPDGKPAIRMELFHDAIQPLVGTTINFELLSGVSLEQAKKLADSMNEWIIGIVVRQSGTDTAM